MRYALTKINIHTDQIDEIILRFLIKNSLEDTI